MREKDVTLIKCQTRISIHPLDLKTFQLQSGNVILMPR